MSYRIWIFGPASFPIDLHGTGVVCVCGVEVGLSFVVKERKRNLEYCRSGVTLETLGFVDGHGLSHPKETNA
jgi:hypothetical protein